MSAGQAEVGVIVGCVFSSGGGWDDCVCMLACVRVCVHVCVLYMCVWVRVWYSVF